MKLEIGKVVMHKSLGLCKVLEVTKRDDIPYYKLQTISPPCSKLFVPAKNDNDTCRNIMNKEDVEELFEYMKTMDPDTTLQNKQKKEMFTKMLHSNDPKQLAYLTRTLYLYREEKRNKKQILGVEDTHIYEQAAKQLHEEIGYVYGIPQDEVVNLIIEKIKA